MLTMLLVMLLLVPSSGQAVYNCLATGEKNVPKCCCDPATSEPASTDVDCCTEESPNQDAACRSDSDDTSPTSLLAAIGCCEVTYSERTPSRFVSRGDAGDRAKAASAASTTSNPSAVITFYEPRTLFGRLANRAPPPHRTHLLLSRFTC